MGLLSRRRAPRVQFTRMGETIGGPVVEDAKEVQQKDFDTDLRVYWGPGKTMVTDPIDPATGKERQPVMMLVVAVDTGHRDPAIDGDDGVRAFFCKTGLLRAVQAECARLRITEIPAGSEFYATWTHDEPLPAGRKGKPSHEFTVRIVPAPAGPGLLAPAQPEADAADPAPPYASGGVVGQGVRAVADQLGRAHASSPLAGRLGLKPATTVPDEEPPF